MRLSRVMSRATVLATVAALSWGVALGAGAATFRSGSNDRNDVSFRSKAPLETITGKTAKAWAEVMLGDVGDLSKKLAASISVDLASLDTDIALRDQHMRDQYLETDKHPKAVFTLNEVVSAYTTSEADGQGAHTMAHGLKHGVETHLVAKGTLELHGVTRKITVDDLSVTYYAQGAESKAVFRGDDGDMLIVSGSVGVKLSDYEIKRPQFVLLKLADDVRVSFSVSLSTGVSAHSGESMEGCGGCGDGCGGCGDGCGGCGDGACGGCGDGACGGCGDGCGGCGDGACGGCGDGCGGCGDGACGGCGDGGCGDGACGDDGCGDGGCGL